MAPVRLFQEHLSNEKRNPTAAWKKGVGDELFDEKVVLVGTWYQVHGTMYQLGFIKCEAVSNESGSADAT